ncbi:hypothetical protein M413DRAFT_6130 [Hebeloma cylindrosporum]|uniref:Uncharacterized protein n=1 Tax=Hebeloma cylindrosporum TaxID=76867 RepID=A0A0C2YGI1_HEBCY|nr:hypothetical protein M413DRAFT_6130 [Hebeloma cylindrosporum h7]
MDSLPLQPVPTVEQCGVQNPGAPVRGRARRQSGWDILLGNDDMFKAIMEKSKELNENLLSHISPSTCRKQATTSDDWLKLVNKLEGPEFDEEQLWHIDIIGKHGMNMVPVLFELSRGGGKGEDDFVAAKTLLTKAMQFANCICQFGCDPRTSLKAGSKFIYSGFLQKLLDQTYTSKFIQPLFVTTNKLQHHLNVKVYFSHEEFQLIIKQALEDTKVSGRKITLQRLAVVGPAFIIALRPSSLGPCEKEYEEHGKYPKIKNIDVHQVGAMCWCVCITIENFKGHNTSVKGLSQSVTLEPVKNWYNVPFDIAFWLVMHLLARGAFKDIKTKEDLVRNKSCRLHFKPEFLDQPLLGLPHLASSLGITRSQ